MHCLLLGSSCIALSTSSGIQDCSANFQVVPFHSNWNSKMVPSGSVTGDPVIIRFLSLHVAHTRSPVRPLEVPSIANRQQQGMSCRSTVLGNCTMNIVGKFRHKFISHSGLKIEREISHAFEEPNFPQRNIPVMKPPPVPVCNKEPPESSQIVPVLLVSIGCFLVHALGICMQH